MFKFPISLFIRISFKINKDCKQNTMIISFLVNLLLSTNYKYVLSRCYGNLIIAIFTYAFHYLKTFPFRY